MSILDYKITDALVALYGVCMLPDVLTGSPAENKKCFDRLVQLGVAPQVNGLIETLASAGGAAEIGAAVEGLAGTTVQQLLEELGGYVVANELKLPAATAVKLGGITVGSGLTADEQGRLSLAGYREGVDLYGDLSGHLADRGCHTTEEERQTWHAKQDAPLRAESLPEAGTALSPNTLYLPAAAVESYQFLPPASGWAHGRITLAEGAEITFGTGSSFVGSAPTLIAGKTYEFDVLDGVWIFAEVVSAA